MRSASHWSGRSAAVPVAARAAGYGFPGVEVDGGDLLLLRRAGREAHERARTGGGPTLIEAHVVRLTSHSSDDDQRRYRDADDVEGLKERDPIPGWRPASANGACSTMRPTRHYGQR